MSIRPMTPPEIITALRRAAVVCLEKRTSIWYSQAVCMADGTYYAASECLVDGDGAEDDPEHAAFFLLMVAAEMEAME